MKPWRRPLFASDPGAAEVEVWAGLACRFGARLDLAGNERRLALSLGFVEVTLWWLAGTYPGRASVTC